jgi:hypothetical protein
MASYYSSEEDINNVFAKLHTPQTEDTRPVFVLDIDGNCAVGYLLNDNIQFDDSLLDYPELQTIPSHYDCEDLVARGLAKHTIFAAKSLDARIAPNLVNAINERLDADDAYSICLLTSRRASDVDYILKASGIKKPDQVTCISDSGNILRIGGKSQTVHTPTEQESLFLDYIQQGHCHSLNTEVKELILASDEHSKLTADNIPNLFIEPKGTALNIHYREIFEQLNIDRDSPLGKKISAHIQESLASITNGDMAPMNENDQPIFELGPGPMTYEIKLANVTKATGMETLCQKVREAGRRPEHIVFSGDDCASKGGIDSYGTDYSAMKWIRENLSPQEGILIHTHHTTNMDFNGTQPDPCKAAPAELNVDITTRTPLETSAIVVNALKTTEENLKKTLAPNADDLDKKGFTP